jgi:hypothetical protein
MLSIENHLRGRPLRSRLLQVMRRVGRDAKPGQGGSEAVHPVGARSPRSMQQQQPRMPARCRWFMLFHLDGDGAALKFLHVIRDAARATPLQFLPALRPSILQ